jgi:Fic family protein
MSRSYQKTHPWITFQFDLNRINYDLWMRLGEAQSKCQHIAGTLLDPKVARQLQQIYLAKGVHATTSIEGNTLSEEQVRKRMDGQLALPESKKYLGQEVDNIVSACNAILAEQCHEPTALTIDEIKRYNALVLYDLPVKEDVVPGQIRKHSVGVARYLGTPAEDCGYLLEQMCHMLNGQRFFLSERWELVSGILKAILAHLYIAWIHPFGDGNGRTARLLELRFCLSVGIPTPAAHLLSNYYNETRAAYYMALDETSKTKSPLPFLEYAIKGYVDQLEEQIFSIRIAQNKAFWINFVHSEFAGRDGEADKRRRNMVLDISEKLMPTQTMHNPTQRWINISEIENVSGRLARAYSSKTQRVKTRDIKELMEMGLINRRGNQIRPNFELINAYLPLKAISAS